MQFSFEIPSTSQKVEWAREHIVERAKKSGFSNDDVAHVKLVLTEALANALHHGNGDDPAKRIMIESEITEDFIEVAVQDEGQGFDPAGVPDPTLPENLEKPSGRGLLLMRTFMDEVAFNEKGNRVTMRLEKNSVEILL